MSIRFPKFANNNQSGITLLLTIIILSAMLAVTFSIAGILLTQLRTSGDLLRTEPAYYAGQGQIEEALFKVKRDNTSSFTYSSQIGNISLPAPQESSTTDPIIHDQVPPNGSFATANTYIFDPTLSPNGSGYGSVTVNYTIDTGDYDQLKVFLCQFDPDYTVDPSGATNPSYNSSPCTDPNGTVQEPGNKSYWWQTPTPDGFTLDSGAHNSWTFTHTLQQELIIYNSGSSGMAYIEIQPYDSSGNPKGIPYYGQESVSVTSQNGDVSRKIRAIIPNQ